LRQFRHWTPRYIFDRLGLMVYQRRRPSTPWLGHEMVRILENWLLPDDRGFEWGSGRSTIWFAERVGSLVSVEHNPDWYRLVNARLKIKGLKNVEYHLCEDELEYRRVASQYPSESFDFILVDGLARDECALAAISLVKPGGIVVVDDCNRYLPTQSRSPFSRRPEQGPDTELWATYQDSVNGWRRIWTTNGVTDSGLWVRPAAIDEPGRDLETLEQFSSRHHP
jgi:SAM-dependent methyltransferase